MSRSVADAVREDPELSPAEKETTIRFAKDRDGARVYTEEAGLIRRIMRHQHADIRGLTELRDGDRRPVVALEDWSGAPVVGVEATVPVGALQIKSRPRAGAGHAAVVAERGLVDVAELPHTDEKPLDCADDEEVTP
jgi:hypothetical protein